MTISPKQRKRRRRGSTPAVVNINQHPGANARVPDADAAMDPNIAVFERILDRQARMNAALRALCLSRALLYEFLQVDADYGPTARKKERARLEQLVLLAQNAQTTIELESGEEAYVMLREQVQPQAQAQEPKA
jgi:hypothetical protein